MNISTNKVDQLNLNVSITLERDDYFPAYDKALREYKKRVNMPGFRPGHVPMGMVKKLYGKSILAEEVNKVLNDTLYKYITEEKLNVIGNPLPVQGDTPEGDWDNPEQFTFTYEMGLAPELDPMKAVKKTPLRYRIKVDEKLLNEHVEDMTRRFGEVSEAEVVEEDGLIEATFIELDKEGNIKEGGFMTSRSLLLSSIDDAKSQKKLVGKKVGDEVDFKPKELKKDIHDLEGFMNITHAQVHDLKGSVRIRIDGVKHMEKHALNQELFDKVLGPDAASNEEEFRAKLSEELEKMFDREAERQFRTELYEGIVENDSIEVPTAFLKRWIKASAENEEAAEEPGEETVKGYTAAIRWQTFRDRVAEKHEIKVEFEELLNEAKAQIASQFSRYGMPVEDEMLQNFAMEQMKDREAVQKLQESLLENKVFEAIGPELKPKEKKISYDDFLKLGSNK